MNRTSKGHFTLFQFFSQIDFLRQKLFLFHGTSLSKITQGRWQGLSTTLWQPKAPPHSRSLLHLFFLILNYLRAVARTFHHPLATKSFPKRRAAIQSVRPHPERYPTDDKGSPRYAKL